MNTIWNGTGVIRHANERPTSQDRYAETHIWFLYLDFSLVVICMKTQSDELNIF